MSVRTRIELTVRVAGPADAEAIRGLDGLGSSTLRLLDRDLSDADHVSLVAEQDGGVVGVALGMLLLDQLHVTDIAVDPVARGAGVGRRLLDELLRDGVARGATSATLEVRPSNTAGRALYAAAGFVPEGRRPGYYPATGDAPAEDALILWRHDLTDVTTNADGGL